MRRRLLLRIPYRLGAAAILLLFLAPALRADAQPFTAGATVVVLTGLPGDVESETLYRDQTKRLLEILAEPGNRPARVHLLVDDPRTIVAPTEVAEASRAKFLALAETLRGKKEPLVVFVWGHGGMQGETPVFHVRGPRVTPEDFRTFAARAGGAGSRWVLSFRGSGAAARALRGAGREVISSEEGTVFRSDPVGMDLLLAALKEEPGLSFEALAREIGFAAVEWYEGQNLARTEEPTYWKGTEAPQRLAAKREAKAAAPATRRAERTGVWKEIEPVDPARFPGVPAVMLRRTWSTTLAESPAVTTEVEEFIQILTEEGERFADVDVTYAPPGETITFLDCEVLKPDGTIERLSPERVLDGAAEPPLGDYVAPSRKVFSLPGAAPGAVLRVRYRSEWKTFPLPYVIHEVPLAGEIPVLSARIEVRAASGAPLHHAFRNFTAPAPKVEPTSYGQSWSWRLADLPAVPREPLSPRGSAPALLLSTFPDWEAFAAWYLRLIREADRVTPEITAKAAELTAGAKDDREKVVRLYDFVTRLRYVSIPLGVNSHRPHSAASVLKNRFGDCKDKANLFNTLLRSQGIAADLVLVPRFTQADDAAPGVAFNHAISRVRLGDEMLFIDTTDDVARFGLLPPGDPGRKVLVVDGASRGLVELPAPDPANHKVTLRTRLAETPDGNFSGSVEVKSSGYADYALRALARQGVAARPVFAWEYRPAAGVFEMAGQTHTPPAALDRDFEWRADGAWAGLAAALPTGGRLLRAPFWLPAEWSEALHARRSPLYLNEGYPLTLDEEVEIAVAPGRKLAALPPVREGGGGPLAWKVEWVKSGPRTATARLRVELRSGELDSGQTVQFQRELRALLGALGEGGIDDLEGHPTAGAAAGSSSGRGR
ncbi:MAG TPA: DUF3857 domain-containing protein [Thermoanaerobaculia bacterium]|nr:DUF3857 domain-containing protein [Thermoanaerobaculia bacterium]